MNLIYKLCLFFVLASVAHADLADLESRKTRPTMLEVLHHRVAIEAEIKEPIREVVSWFDHRLNIPLWLDHLLQSGPKLIATFEQTYPGATWVFLGRDGLPWADLFEAYYLMLGQPNRVIRLGISKPTLVSAQDDDLVRMMQSHGIDTENLPLKHPYVFIDSVSTGFGRQGRRLMSAVYRNWMSKGRDPLLLLNKIDMIGLEVSTFKGVSNDTTLKPLHHYIQALSVLDYETKIPPGRAPLETSLRALTYPQQPQFTNEAGYTHFIGAWHESFGALEQFSNGEVRARPGSDYPIQMKRSILWMQNEIWRYVLDGRCERLVQHWAGLLKFKFPRERPAVRIADSQALRIVRARIARAQRGPQSYPKPIERVLHEDRFGVGDRQALILQVERTPNQLNDYDWKSAVNRPSLLADVQELARALDGGGCGKLLERDP